ncbi:hypothetical protein [Kitasatospora sp. NPDC058478]|uniref:hypothetical protein n=1 Tax=unclassified Kitasatospora TaxID=2633591 RepID=UPI00365FE04D
MSVDTAHRAVGDEFQGDGDAVAGELAGGESTGGHRDRGDRAPPTSMVEETVKVLVSLPSQSALPEAVNDPTRQLRLPAPVPLKLTV